MNCTQVEELLPLYAGHDLAEGREQLVAAHLQSCAACSLTLADYRDMRGLMADFAGPVFDDQVYAEMRKKVWQQIERQPRWRALFAAVAVWFEPQVVWPVAVAVMITLSFVGLYFINKTYNVRPTVIVDIPKTVAPIAATPETQSSDPLVSNQGSPNKRQATMPKRQRKPDQMVAPDRGTSLAAYSPDAEVTTVQRKTGAQPSRLPTRTSETLALQSSDPPVIRTDDLEPGGAAAEKILRMEIQTSDPNIRIIWFSQREPKPLTTPSKGI